MIDCNIMNMEQRSLVPLGAQQFKYSDKQNDLTQSQSQS